VQPREAGDERNDGLLRGICRCSPAASARFRPLRAASTVDCFANAMPFAELAHALGVRERRGNPIFEVRFALTIVPDVALPGMSAKLRMRSTARPLSPCLRNHGGGRTTRSRVALPTETLSRRVEN
jgi:hypothetical protein